MHRLFEVPIQPWGGLLVGESSNIWFLGAAMGEILLEVGQVGVQHREEHHEQGERRGEPQRVGEGGAGPVRPEQPRRVGQEP